MEKDKVNPLGTEPVGRLLRKFAIPSIISMLVTSLYNIVDQFFIGRTVGELGNAGNKYSISPNNYVSCSNACTGNWWCGRV